MNIILLSGGMDSALCLARYGADMAIGFDYGQPHRIELEYSAKIAERFGVPFSVIGLPFMPLVDDVVFAGRNAVMLTAAAAIAQARGIGGVVIGCNMDDAARFPDCRQEFISAMDSALSGAYGVRVIAPLLNSTKAQIVAESREIGLPETWTCYSPTQDGRSCGSCYSCGALATCC